MVVFGVAVGGQAIRLPWFDFCGHCELPPQSGFNWSSQRPSRASAQSIRPHPISS